MGYLSTAKKAMLGISDSCMEKPRRTPAPLQGLRPLLSSGSTARQTAFQLIVVLPSCEFIFWKFFPYKYNGFTNLFCVFSEAVLRMRNVLPRDTPQSHPSASSPPPASPGVEENNGNLGAESGAEAASHQIAEQELLLEHQGQSQDFRGFLQSLGLGSQAEEGELGAGPGPIGFDEVGTQAVQVEGGDGVMGNRQPELLNGEIQNQVRF